MAVIAFAAMAGPSNLAPAWAQVAEHTEAPSTVATERAAIETAHAKQPTASRNENSTGNIGLSILLGALLLGLAIVLRPALNNVIAGLLLRSGGAIKVGDLIAVAGREGRVRHITLRATEIEMDDKASFLVPNATLLASPVLNRTHRGVLGRVSVQVIAAYSADPEQVRNILQKVVQDSPLVVPTSAAGTTFDGFGPNGYEFSLNAVVSDVSRAREAETDLRFRIVRALRAAGIEMPHGQHDIHLRDLDKLWGALASLAAERAAAQRNTDKKSNTAPDTGLPKKREAVRRA